jgi:hypothetical protein
MEDPPAFLNLASQKCNGFFVIACLLAQRFQFGVSFNLRFPQLAHFRGEVCFSAVGDLQGG